MGRRKWKENRPKSMEAAPLLKARKLHLLHLAQSRGIPSINPAGMEEYVNENRVKTFIELTRQTLEEDRFGQVDLSWRRTTTRNDPRPHSKAERESLRRKG
jgi:hypothetical protein